MQRSSAPYFPLFDWLRFTLAFLVMASHFGLIPSLPHAGNFAVQVFFALSGWLIGGILLDTGLRDLPRFYFNRVLRIWGPYYLALAFLVVASLLREPVSAKWLEFVAYKALFVWNLFGTQQLGQAINAMPLKGTGNHFWSVNAEEQFYLLAPLLLVFVPKFGRHPAVWLALGIGACLAGSLYAAVILGVLAATLQARWPGFHRSTLSRTTCVALLGASITLGWSGEDYYRAAPLAGIAIVLLLAIEGRKGAVGGLAGGLSYQLYLNHWIGGFVSTVLMIALHERGHPASPYVGMGLSVALAAGLYWWIDRPLLAARGRLYTRQRGVVAMAAGALIVLTGIAYGVFQEPGHPARPIVGLAVSMALVAALYWWLDRNLLPALGLVGHAQREVVAISSVAALVLAGVAYGVLTAAPPPQ